MSAAPRPFFSVLIPSYNRPERITQCVESVLANKGEDFEIIISDDASSQREAIAKAINPYLTQPNVHFLEQQTNVGEPANRNFLVSRATGQYNIILCDDDTLFPHSLRTIRHYIQTNPDNDLYAFGYRIVDEAGMSSHDRVAPKALSISLDQSLLVRQMFEGRWLPFLVFHPATFCCKRGIEKEIPYRQDVSTADDYMFLLECLNAGKRIFVLPECLMSYRWVQYDGKTKQINQSSDTMKVLNAYTKVYYSLRQRTDLHSSISSFIHSSEYRKRFLYHLFFRRMRKNEDCGSLLNLEEAHYRELLKYRTTLRRIAVSLGFSLETTSELVQHFKLHGLCYAIKLGMAHLRNSKVLVPVQRPSTREGKGF